ncbi:DUF4303 domain-containing protein [Pseudomonas syringae group genomosp. 3]|uniref:DUF4303 domain-containing protein n=1 Tax=Pseudomonas syringae pv. viburni TaxID=251703 RepID=A0A0Q0E9Q5_9PSED|nr:DUF4303 domain-containing protein [Pseudomonas syringae group genomosp. 3]KPZ10248.1 hypothetical protein ALO40_01914 [Pseudomonas syringae pv. viburni]
MKISDIDNLKEKIRVAVELAIESISIKFPKEEICAFALYSDSDARTLAASFNLKAHLNSLQAEDPGDKVYYKWSPAEWSHESYEVHLFDDISSKLAKLSDTLGEGENFEQYRKTIFESCVCVLEAFKNRLGDSIFVFAVTDFSDVNLESSWIKILNSSDESVEFEAWRTTE